MNELINHRKPNRDKITLFAPFDFTYISWQMCVCVLNDVENVSHRIANVLNEVEGPDKLALGKHPEYGECFFMLSGEGCTMEVVGDAIEDALQDVDVVYDISKVHGEQESGTLLHQLGTLPVYKDTET